MAFKQTPSQTIGPFFSFGLASEQYGHALDQLAGGNLLVLRTRAAPGAEKLGACHDRRKIGQRLVSS